MFDDIIMHLILLLQYVNYCINILINAILIILLMVFIIELIIDQSVIHPVFLFVTISFHHSILRLT